MTHRVAVMYLGKIVEGRADHLVLTARKVMIETRPAQPRRFRNGGEARSIIAMTPKDVSYLRYNIFAGASYRRHGQT
jgi:hypothetical protein